MKGKRSHHHGVVLLAVLLAAALLGGCGDPNKKTAVGMNVCTSCHTVVTADWLASKHGNLDPGGTLDSPGVPTNAQMLSSCTNCHDPNGDSAKLVPGYTGTAGIARPVIGCEACHGSGSLHAQAGGTGPISLAGSAGVIGTTSTVQVSAQFATCTSCHELLSLTDPANTAITATAAHDAGGSDPRIASEGTNTNIITNTNTNSITDTHFARPNAWDANNGGLNTHNTATDFIAITGYAMNFSDSKVCTNCHNPHKNAVINREWAQSGHADPQGIKIDQTSSAVVGNGFFSSAWAHYNWSDRPTCMRCKSTTAFAAYTDAIRAGNTALVTAFRLGTARALETDPNWKPEMLQCNGCHTDNKGNLRNPGAVTANYDLDVTASVKGSFASFSFPDLAGSNVCMLCHTGREIGETIKGLNDPALLSAGTITSTDFTSRSFINSHYLTGGATVFTVSGYEFGARAYENIAAYRHDKIGTSAAPGTGSNGPCIGCHMSRPNKNGNHIFLPVSRISSKGTVTITGIASEVCFTCHGPNDVLMLDIVREQRELYHEALEALKDRLEQRGFYFSDFSPYFYQLRDNAGLVSVTTGSAVVTGIGTNWVTSKVTGTAYPKTADRFRVDGDGAYYTVKSRESDTQITLQSPYAGTANPAAVYTIITSATRNWLTKTGPAPFTTPDPDTTGATSGRNNMGAAFNFNLFEHDPGAYAHNRYYVKRLIYDSLDWLDDNNLNYSVGTTLTTVCNATPKTWCDRTQTYLLPNGVINGVAAERP
jgi:hypothetical protein